MKISNDITNGIGNICLIMLIEETLHCCQQTLLPFKSREVEFALQVMEIQTHCLQRIHGH